MLAVAMLQSVFGQMTPHMSDAEVECYRSYLGQADRLVEYGSGGSTFLAISLGIPEILTVESDVKWVRRLKRNLHIRRALRSGQLRLRHVDIGRTEKWGKPGNERNRSNWPLYPAAPWEILDSPDVVFVDGRFRVACIAQCVLNRVPVIVVHDFWNRPKYHDTLSILEKLDEADTLGIFRPKADEEKKAGELLKGYQFTFS